MNPIYALLEYRNEEGKFEKIFIICSRDLQENFLHKFQAGHEIFGKTIVHITIYSDSEYYFEALNAYSEGKI